MRYLFYILTGAVTVLFSSVLFYNNPQLANGQLISGYFAYQIIALICLAVALAAIFLDDIPVQQFDKTIAFHLIIVLLTLFLPSSASM